MNGLVILTSEDINQVQTQHYAILSNKTYYFWTDEILLKWRSPTPSRIATFGIKKYGVVQSIIRYIEPPAATHGAAGGRVQTLNFRSADIRV